MSIGENTACRIVVLPVAHRTGIVDLPGLVTVGNHRVVIGERRCLGRDIDVKSNGDAAAAV